MVPITAVYVYKQIGTRTLFCYWNQLFHCSKMAVWCSGLGLRRPKFSSHLLVDFWQNASFCPSVSPLLTGDNDTLSNSLRSSYSQYSAKPKYLLQEAVFPYHLGATVSLERHLTLYHTQKINLNEGLFISIIAPLNPSQRSGSLWTRCYTAFQII